MSTSSDAQSSMSSSVPPWWSPSSWVPDPTQDPSLTLLTSTTYPDLSPATSESDSPTWSQLTWTWTETGLPTVTGARSPLTSPFTSLSRPIETQTSQADSAGPNTKRTVAISIATSILAMAGLVYLIRLRIRKRSHQRLYSDPDDLSTMTFINTTGQNGGEEAFDFGVAVGVRDGEGDSRERIPSQELGRWYYNERRPPYGEASSILQPPFTRSGTPFCPTEREMYFLGLGVHKSPTVQSRTSGQFVKDANGPSSPPDPPRYSQILQPTRHPLRPLPVPKNPRALLPQRRVDSIQVRMQKKPPLILSSTTSLPFPSSPPTFSSSLPSTGLNELSAFQFPPLLPQRRTEHSTEVPPSSCLSNPSPSPLTPLRLAPSVSFNRIPQTKHRTNLSTNQTVKKKLKPKEINSDDMH